MINIISKYGTTIDLKLYQLKICKIWGSHSVVSEDMPFMNEQQFLEI